MDKDIYCDTLVIKHHLNTSTCQKVDSNRDKLTFNNLKFLIKKRESCLIKNELKGILNSNWNLSTFYLLLKMHLSQKIIEKVNKNNNICVKMKSPEDLKKRPIVYGSNSLPQGISDLLEKILTPSCFMF